MFCLSAHLPVCELDTKNKQSSFTLKKISYVVDCRFLPKIAEKIAKAVRPFSAIFVIFILGFGTYVNWYMVDIIEDDLIILPACFLLPVLGYLCGFLAAIIFRQGRKVATTISIETGVQNASIPILVLQRSFPQPVGDLAAVMPLATAYVYSIPILCAWAGLVAYSRCTGKDPLATEEGKTEDAAKEKDTEIAYIDQKTQSY